MRLVLAAILVVLALLVFHGLVLALLVVAAVALVAHHFHRGRRHGRLGKDAEAVGLYEAAKRARRDGHGLIADGLDLEALRKWRQR